MLEKRELHKIRASIFTETMQTFNTQKLVLCFLQSTVLLNWIVNTDLNIPKVHTIVWDRNAFVSSWSFFFHLSHFVLSTYLITTTYIVYSLFRSILTSTYFSPLFNFPHPKLSYNLLFWSILEIVMREVTEIHMMIEDIQN